MGLSANGEEEQVLPLQPYQFSGGAEVISDQKYQITAGDVSFVFVAVGKAWAGEHRLTQHQTGIAQAETIGVSVERESVLIALTLNVLA